MEFGGEFIDYLKVDKKYKVNYEEGMVKVENVEKIQEMVDWVSNK